MSKEVVKTAPAEGGQAGAGAKAPAEKIYAWANKIENMKPLYIIDIDDVIYEVHDDGGCVFRDALEDVVEFGVWDYV